MQNAFTKRFGIKDNLSVKYNPVDREDILSKAEIPLNNINDENAVMQLVTLGRLEPQKGYDRLLEVVNKLKNENLKFNLWIVGEGSKRPELESYIKKHNLEDTVTLQGFQTNPYKYIKNADAFICSSRSEGFSTVVTEALILGKPVVATDCSGMTELLGASEYGLITQNNTEDLYLGMKRFLSDIDLQNHYKKKSEERSKDFDIKSTIKQIENIL